MPQPNFGEGCIETDLWEVQRGLFGNFLGQACIENQVIKSNLNASLLCSVINFFIDATHTFRRRDSHRILIVQKSSQLTSTSDTVELPKTLITNY